MTGCDLRIADFNSNKSKRMVVAIHALSSVGVSSIRGAIEAIEDALIKNVIVSEPSRARFLYDMAMEYSEVKPDGSVQQRNPFNSSERVWMNVVDIPLIKDDKKCYVSPFLDGKVNDEIHAAKSCLEICKENFGNEVHRCNPYVLVTSKQAKNAAFATAAVKNAIKRHAQKTAAFEVSMSVPADAPSRPAPLALNVKHQPSKPTFKSRKITIPSWLMSDEVLRQDMQSKSIDLSFGSVGF